MASKILLGCIFQLMLFMNELCSMYLGMYYVRSFEQSFGARPFVVSESLQSRAHWSQIIFNSHDTLFLLHKEKKVETIDKYYLVKLKVM